MIQHQDVSFLTVITIDSSEGTLRALASGCGFSHTGHLSVARRFTLLFPPGISGYNYQYLTKMRVTMQNLIY